MSFLDLVPFETSSSVLREAALKLRTTDSSVTISASLDENGIIAAAILEGSLLDAGIPYQRRLRDNPSPSNGPCICIHSETSSTLQPVDLILCASTSLPSRSMRCLEVMVLREKVFFLRSQSVQHSGNQFPHQVQCLGC